MSNVSTLPPVASSPGYSGATTTVTAAPAAPTPNGVDGGTSVADVLHKIIAKVGFSEADTLAMHHAIANDSTHGVGDGTNPYVLLPQTLVDENARRALEIAELTAQVQALEIENLRQKLAAAQADSIPAVPAAGSAPIPATVTPSFVPADQLAPAAPATPAGSFVPPSATGTSS